MDKKCSKCGKIKPIDHFYNKRTTKDGKHGQCIPCHKAGQKSKTKEQANRDARNYALRNPEKIKIRFKKWYEANKEEYLSRRSILEQRPERKTKVRAFNQRYKPIANAKRRERRKNMPPKEKMEKTMRDRFHKVIIRMKSGIKYTSWRNLIGCNIDELKQHIENQFIDGMCWANHGNGHGKWNIDHIKPLVKFDLFKIEDQQQAFHFTNLRPLWFEENMARNRKNWENLPQ